jgi:hypothetical protein
MATLRQIMTQAMCQHGFSPNPAQLSLWSLPAPA